MKRTSLPRKSLIATSFLIGMIECSALASNTQFGEPFGSTKMIKTTAYTHAESGHRTSKNAIGGSLKAGKLASASADWSRYPVGTRFRVVSTGQEFVIDDYGSAMVGSDMIDLYKPSLAAMRSWGSRKVEIEILEWGCYEKSLEILEDRRGARYVRKMISSLKEKTTSPNESRNSER